MNRGPTVQPNSAAATGTTPKLRRVLGLWDLVYYGVILTSPIAVVPMFGEAQVLSRGHALIALLSAMVAMTATASALGLQESTLVAGAIWLAAGAFYVVLKKKVLGQPVVIDFSES